MKKFLFSLITVLLMVGMVTGATTAYFSDTETSTGNTFATGTLDLNLDGSNSNIVKFTVPNMKPEDSQTGTWRVNNVGSMAGYLDLQNITQTHSAGTTTESELAVENPDVGTLGSLLNVNLFVDVNNNGVLDAGETTIYSGLIGSMATDYNQNLSLVAGATNYITMIVSWPSSANDNKGQGDTVQLDIIFELGQTAGQ